MTGQFLTEIGVEELPSRHCQAILEQLTTDVLIQKAEDHNLLLTRPKLFITPRRIVLVARNITQKETHKEVIGPLYSIAFSRGRPNKVAEKFAQAQGVSPDHLTKKTVNGRNFVSAMQDLSKNIANDIQAFISDLLQTIVIDKPMRWNATNLKFSRPIRWVVCMIGTHSIPISIAGIQSSRTSYGPRFAGTKPITVQSADSYEDLLAKHKIIVDHDKRILLIQKVLRSLSEKKKLDAQDPNDEMVHETAFLTEYPEPFICSFDSTFLSMPQDITATVLKHHLKAFPLYHTKGKDLSSMFLFIGNHSRDSDIIRTGIEKVVTARLKDARYFYEQDTNRKLSEFSSRTNTITFHEQLGSMKDKTVRMRAISLSLSSYFDVRDSDIETATEICKADLASDIVTELPSLEGTIGRIYAEREHIPRHIAQAIEEYYYPRSASDRLPKGDLGTLLSIAERIDTVYGLFSIGFQPKGRSDPFGIRRAGIALVRILWEKGYDIPLQTVIKAAQDAYQKQLQPDEIQAFLLQRLEQYLKESPKHYVISDTNLLRAVLYNSETVLACKKKQCAEIRHEESAGQFPKLLELIKRVHNIAVRDTEIKEISIDESSLNNTEKALLNTSDNLKLKETLIPSDLYPLIPVATEFFDANLVMSKIQRERMNRIGILLRVYSQIQRVINAAYLLG